jgi:hypothetical protein
MPRGGGQDAIREIMGKFKRGELYSGGGPDELGEKVDKRDQAIAIALSEAGIERRAGSNPLYSKKRIPRERESKRRKRPMFGI